MKIKDVEKLAELARIELSVEEKEELLKDMGSILEYVNQIKEANVGDLKSEYIQKNVWREDVPEKREFDRELIVKQFPDKQDNFFEG